MGEAAAEAAPWVETLARAGFAAKGLVYALVGYLALQAAIGSGGKTTDSSGALRTLLTQPFGQILLGVVAVGLFGYALWRLVQAFCDPSGKEADAKRIAKRIGYAASGIAYGALGVAAVQMAVGLGGGSSRGGGDGAAQDWTARFLAQPFGPWLVGLAGLFIIGLGINFLYIAWSCAFEKKLALGEMSDSARKWTLLAGRAGHAARGVVFLLIGAFLIQAARQSDPKEAHGLSGALHTLGQQSYGPWLLGIVAAGLIGYGLFMLFSARYRKVWA